MKLQHGFRIPEKSDRAIRWPSRNGETPDIAVWRDSSLAWYVPGVERAFGSGLELIQQFGNDWTAVTITDVPEVSA